MKQEKDPMTKDRSMRVMLRWMIMCISAIGMSVSALAQYQGGQGKGFVMVGVFILDCQNDTNGLAMPGTSCDDGQMNTVNDTWTSGCQCLGELDTDLDGIPDTIDDCPNLAGQIGDACDDGDCYTENDVITENCVCLGIGSGEEGNIFGNSILADGLMYWFSTDDVDGAIYTWTVHPNDVGWQLDAQGPVVSVIAPSLNGEAELCVSATIGEECVLQACIPLYVMDVGLAECMGADGSFLIRPNPNDGRFEILIDAPDNAPLKYEVLDATGRSQRTSGIITGAKGMVDLGAVAPGPYLLKLRNAAGSRTLRVVVGR